jgi:predicted aldo/keto reductase-like oxidoreductase
MEQITFGKTGLTVGRTGFGCIPIQRIPYDESTALLRRAYENGVTVYDTAHGYTTSEERIGIALGEVRSKVVLCTKAMAQTPSELTACLDNSLKMMRTGYVDVFQFHNPGAVPLPGGEDGLYDTLLEAKKQGKVRHIGISAHKRETAEEAVASGFYDVLQYPFSYLSTPREMAVAELCRTHNVGILGMKALCGGILTNAKAAFAYLRPYNNIVPIWGMQETAQLDEILAYENSPPVLDEALQAVIDADRKELAGQFCRACGYCLPCPAGVEIAKCLACLNLARSARNDSWNCRKVYRKLFEAGVDGSRCTGCGVCEAKCPQKLGIMDALKETHKTMLSFKWDIP